VKPLAEALGAWAPKDEGSAAADPVALLVAGWRDIVGEEVARHSHPVRLVDGTLNVMARSNGWSHELSFLSPRILDAVRARFPKAEVRELRFRVGKLPAPAQRPAPRGREDSHEQTPRDADRPPSATAHEAVARFRAGVERRRRAQAARGWKECRACEALIAPGGGELCITCLNAGAHERSAAVARLLFEAPWLGYDATAALVEGLTRREYESIRSALLSRWWETLGRAVRAKRLSHDGRERSIASSYVLLKTKLAPEEIAPATVRDVLGDELHDLIYGTETYGRTNVEQ
jgi:hypothetical protein